MSGNEEQAGNKVEIIRLDLLSVIGRQAAREYGVQMVLATLLFDGKGDLIDRQIGRPQADRVIETIQNSRLRHSP